MEQPTKPGDSNDGSLAREESNDQSEPLSKMTAGGQDLRDHDFPVARELAGRQGGPARVDTDAPPPENVYSGGKPGEIDGDEQKVGSVGAIMDQVVAEPSTPVDR